MALIVGKEHPRLVQSDEIGQAARMARRSHEKEVEDNARRAEERRKRLEAEEARRKAEVPVEPAEAEEESPKAEETPKSDKPVADAEETRAEHFQSSFVIDGSQIRQMPKEPARKPKAKK